MTYPIRVIAFDMGRVLIDFEHFVFCQNMIPYCNGLTATQIYQKLFGCLKAINWWNNYEKGHIDTLTFVESIRNKLKLDSKFELEELIDIVATSFFLNEGILEIIDSLIVKKVPIFIISNISELHWFALYKKFPDLVGRFPKENRILSFEVGFRKPDSRIYLYLKRRFGAIYGFNSREIQDILFIDDRKENIYEFERLGGQTIQYNCREQTTKWLAETIKTYKVW
ncbi:MAG: hypothetical protein CO137_00975 [Candidatus Magasanikbacteria bacterium CG_4_9_14_3_um_filter_32_9]|uniref:HAD family phosphatase n=1 Tax=Candidatus Magasanikbacteria bacterium CG_4_9_14_3_um_filter_32_9 TaxID=1974644 RepID=A0A2M7Z7B6_9BACT|nr:MAG: hypothetical protein CO137_00975 [Candidatus Magasanikbacteria bacterium CG_4_9_14_3_um_filter_32_9]